MTKHRKLKTLLYICIVILALAILVSFLDLQSPTAEIALRRQEKAQLVGPSAIIGYDDIKSEYGYDHKAIIGESEYGYTLFEYMESDTSQYCYDAGSLTYHKKQDGFTTFTTHDGYLHISYDGAVYPLWVFTDDQAAEQAHLSLECSYTLQGELYHQTYTFQAQRSENGYFLFMWDFSDEQDWIALDFLWERLNSLEKTSQFASGSATLELYNHDGQLLDTLTREYPCLNEQSN